MMSQRAKLDELLRTHKPFQRWLFWRIFSSESAGVSRSPYSNPLTLFLRDKGISVNGVARYDVFYKVGEEERNFPVPRWGVDFLARVDSRAAGTFLSARECRKILKDSLRQRAEK